MHNVIFLLSLSPLNYKSIDYLQSWLDFVFPNNDDLPVTMTESRAMGVRVVQIFPPFFRLNFRPFTT